MTPRQRMQLLQKQVSAAPRISPGQLLNISEETQWKQSPEECRAAIWSRFAYYIDKGLSFPSYHCVNINAHSRIQTGPTFASRQPQVPFLSDPASYLDVAWLP